MTYCWDFTQENLYMVKRNLKREAVFLLIAAQNNAIRTNYIKMKTDNIRQNGKYWLDGNCDEMVNHIMSECNKLAEKEYNTRHDWVGKVIPWEWCKKLKFDHTTK